MPLDPGVERGLRLFEQRDVLIAGLFGGLQRQVARHGVERGGHRHQHLLLGERRIGHRAVPGVPQMVQIAAAGLHRRKFGHAFGRAEGQDGRGAVHAAMRKPRLRRRHQAAGIFHAALLRQAADHGFGLRIPGQRRRAGGKIGRAGNIEERRQQVFVAHFRRVHQLRDAQQFDFGQGERIGIRPVLHVRERGVSGAEVDTDDVARFHS